MSIISLREHEVRHGVYVIEVIRDAVFERRSTGADRESAMSPLKRTLRLAASEGRRAEEILEYLEPGKETGHGA